LRSCGSRWNISSSNISNCSKPSTIPNNNIKIRWKGKGLKEKAYDENDNSIVECDTTYLRPLEVDTLLGDYRKAKKILKWKPKINIKQLAKEMVENELKELRLSSDYQKL
jgi:GDP-D-mannose dehydratase